MIKRWKAYPGLVISSVRLVDCFVVQGPKRMFAVQSGSVSRLGDIASGKDDSRRECAG